MLPGGESMGRLTAWLRNYTGDELQWEAQLILQERDVPETELGKGQAGRLGQTTWLTSGPLGHDADDLVVVPSCA